MTADTFRNIDPKVFFDDLHLNNKIGTKRLVPKIKSRIGLRRREGNREQTSRMQYNSSINKHDIFGIVQTHADSNSNLQIHDFRHYFKQRENSKGKRNSGGIAVYIRKTIIEGTSFATARNKNILWIKLDKSFFELDKDLYLGIVYISPNTSHQVID